MSLGKTACQVAEEAGERLASEYMKETHSLAELSAKRASPDFPKEINRPGDVDAKIAALSSYIDKMEVSMDANMGIIRTKYENKLSHVNSAAASSVVVRDGRYQSQIDGAKTQPEDTEESWKIGAAARARGALLLVSKANKPDKGMLDASSMVSVEILSALEKHEKFLALAKDPEEKKAVTQLLDYQLVKILKDSNLKVGGVTLGTAEDIPTMLKEARDMANLTTANHPTIISISDNMLSPNNEKGPLYNITTSIPVNPRSEGLPIKETGWYKQLAKSTDPNDKVRLVLTNACEAALSDGKHTQPTQARWMGGIANGYFQTVRFSNKDGQSVEDNGVKDGFSTLRSASPVYGKGKEKDDELVQHETRQNLKYQKSLSGSAKSITVNHEGDIVDPLKKAAGMDMVALKNVVGQYIFDNSHLHVHEKVSIAIKLLDQAIDQKNTKDISAAIGVLEQYSQEPGLDKLIPKLKEVAVEYGIEACPISVAVAKASNLRDAASEVANSKGEPIGVSCKSGKDRTEALMKEAMCICVKKRLNAMGITDEKEIENAMLVVQKMNHGEMLAGSSGASQGCYGTKIENVFRGLQASNIFNAQEINVLKLKYLTVNEICNLNEIKPLKEGVVKGLIAEYEQRAKLQEVAQSPKGQEVITSLQVTEMSSGGGVSDTARNAAAKASGLQSRRSPQQQLRINHDQ